MLRTSGSISNKNVYGLPNRYIKGADCWRVTLQQGNKKWPSIYEVTPSHLDRALAWGVVQNDGGVYYALHYQPGNRGDLKNLVPVGTFSTFEDAALAIFKEINSKYNMF